MIRSVTKLANTLSTSRILLVGTTGFKDSFQSLKRAKSRTSFYSTSSAPSPTLRARFKPWPVMAGDWSAVLETYARYKNPLDELADGIYLASDEKTLTIFDGFEKAKYHFLVMPRDPFPLLDSKVILPSPHLRSLSSLLKSPHCLEVLEALEVAGKKVKLMIEDEMMKRDGFVWDVQLGFHGSESMRHVHLHVISSDLISPKLKNKKHYNSFHPNLGFFLHLSDLLEEVKKGNFSQPSASQFESILKEPLVSFYDDEEYKNIPKLKDHLVLEWEKLKRNGKKKIELEAKRVLSADEEIEQRESKKLKVS